MSDTSYDHARTRWAEGYESRYGYPPGDYCPICEDASIGLDVPAPNGYSIHVVCRHCGYWDGAAIVRDTSHELHCDDCGRYHAIGTPCLG